MNQGIIAVLVGAAVVAACTPKLSDPPDYTAAARGDWAKVGDCIYADLLTTQEQSAGNVTIAKQEAQKRAIISQSGGGGDASFVITTTARADGGSAVEVRWSLLAPGAGYDTMAKAAITNCSN